MLVYSLFALAHADTICAEPSNIDAASAGASGLAVHVDGSLLVLPSDGDRVSVVVCGGDARLIRREATLDLTSRGDPISVTVYLPASIRALTLHERKGSAIIRVPARVALVSSEGPAEVAGAESLRVSFHVGDIAASSIRGDITVDKLTGELSVDGQPRPL